MNPISATGAMQAFPSEKSESFDGQGDIETATILDASDSEKVVLSTERDIATHIISVDDDSTLNPWTFRAFFIGLGLSTFGGVLGELLQLKFELVSSADHPCQCCSRNLLFQARASLNMHNVET